MERLRFWLNDQLVEEQHVLPTTTVLNYVRERGLTGTKEGCAEGDCGACTVVLLEHDASGEPAYRAVNSCLLLLPMLQGRRLYTVEALRRDGRLHPVQESMVRHLGSQCGYCTPGVVMSMFEACYRKDLTESWQIDDQMCGNLCRCTGYRPIREATKEIAATFPLDHFSRTLQSTKAESMALAYAQADHRYHQPTTLDELFEVLEANPEAKIICGGTDLSLTLTKRNEPLPLLVSVEGIPELRTIRRDAEGWTIGAAATLTAIHDATRAELPAVDKMIRFFASRQIKNRGTLGGNLCNASPIGDMAPVLLALGATLVLQSKSGKREVPIDQFFLAYRKTALQPGEILAEIRIPSLPENARASSYKVSKRRELDISSVAAGCYVELDPSGTVIAARFGYGGMAATPARARHAEAALIGKRWSLESVEKAAKKLDQDFQPLTDHRGSSWFRATLARNLLIGFYLETADGPLRKLSPRPSSTVHLEVNR